ncbi:hypothetical protein QNH10_07725 [Sporosarcina thermotolerans]|nr:hypothetical protein [Sporosarcina thermotolerans]WHT49418.1 hypothetical protein QNH10_07725 [Sporosarcina thermotolerans]
MQKDGLISLAEEDGRRKTYEITQEGKVALRVEFNRLKSQIADGKMIEEGEYENG